MNGDQERRHRDYDSAEKERRDLAYGVRGPPPVVYQDYKRVGLLEGYNTDEVIEDLSEEEQMMLDRWVDFLLKLDKKLKQKWKKWNRDHIKVCMNPECREFVNREEDRCPVCNRPARWYKMDEKGQPTVIENEKSPPARTVGEQWPKPFREAKKILSRGQKEMNNEMLREATNGTDRGRKIEVYDTRRTENE